MNVTSVSAGLLSTPNIAKQPDKLHDAAQQFESLMINEMLKSIRENSSSGWLGSDDDSDSGQSSATEMAEAQFATALAKSGGLGLSHMIEQSIGK